jgi:hypothetical protein
LRIFVSFFHAYLQIYVAAINGDENTIFKWG